MEFRRPYCDASLMGNDGSYTHTEIETEAEHFAPIGVGALEALLTIRRRMRPLTECERQTLARLAREILATTEAVPAALRHRETHHPMNAMHANTPINAADAGHPIGDCKQICSGAIASLPIPPPTLERLADDRRRDNGVEREPDAHDRCHSVLAIAVVRLGEKEQPKDDERRDGDDG